MKKLTILFLFLVCVSCTDNKKIIEQSKAMHADSAKIDSINFVKLKEQNEKFNDIILNGRWYSIDELDSINTGKK